MIHIKNIETGEHRILASKEEIAIIKKEFDDGPERASQILARLKTVLEKMSIRDSALVKCALMNNWQWQEENDVFDIDVPWVQVFAPVDNVDLKIKNLPETAPELKADPLYRWKTSFDSRT